MALALATAIGAAGLAAGGTSGALLGSALISGSAAGLPLGLLVVGSAGAALMISRRSAHVGRTRSLALGYLVGALGAAVVVVAASAHSVVALLVGSALLGAANAAIFLTRYAGAELGGPQARGRALGAVLAATALGAIASPNLLGPSGTLAEALGLPRLAGLYLVALLAFGVAALILARMSNAGRAGDEPPARAHSRGSLTRRELRGGLTARPVRAALVVLAASNLIMVAVMAVAPVHMQAHDQPLTVIGVVISIHVAGMFAPSPLTGWLADRTGAATVATLGIVVLICAGIAGALTAGAGTLATTVVLAALGIGWNCGVIGSSILLAASAAPALRPHAEGVGEAAMGLAAAVGAPVAGMVLALGSLPAVWVLTAALAALVVPVARVRAVASTGS